MTMMMIVLNTNTISRSTLQTRVLLLLSHYYNLNPGHISSEAYALICQRFDCSTHCLFGILTPWLFNDAMLARRTHWLPAVSTSSVLKVALFVCSAHCLLDVSKSSVLKVALFVCSAHCLLVVSTSSVLKVACLSAQHTACWMSLRHRY